jgi:hypothetical protein
MTIKISGGRLEEDLGKVRSHLGSYLWMAAPFADADCEGRFRSSHGLEQLEPFPRQN